ncbi:MAG: bi-domain-containing oxidoreductase [Verrucomicrobia bacterium]|nr:bi-domain-containing oxidoreductase [Verrucomicrobiota bacterium]
MKQLAQYQDGRLEIQEVPQPTPPPAGVLVRTTHSVVSVGTEKMKVEQARMNLLQKARARPDQVRKVLETARNLGWRSALEKVRNRLESPTPLGYSTAGIVVAVDPANTRFRVGDRVACGGAECAFHAEFIAVPDLLAAPVPAAVPNWQAAYTTLGSIALHAVRQTEPQLGDRVLVLGQGLIGLLLTNLLTLAGARVMAVDLLPARRPFSRAMGAEHTVILGEQNLREEVRAWTDGYGVDAVVLCTATQSNTPIEQAAEACRDRGRLVDVGITHIELPWKLFNEKELEVRFSRSYGPGRYDLNYEWGGHDYPVGYVRWTEQRNFQACLQLMAEQKLRLEALTTRRVPFLQALPVYQALGAGGADVGIVLEYPAAAEETGPPGGATPPIQAQRPAGADLAQKLSSPVTRLDVIGAGNFARTMLLPHLRGQIPFGTVVNQTALSANHVKTKFGFQRAETEAQRVFEAAGSAAVIIATRHHLHAPLVKAAVATGRHVFVEKPICLTRAELAELDTAVAASQATVQVGFNRRFAPASQELQRLLAAAPGPKSLSYRVMAGTLDPQHWMANFSESGGRVLGEVCHFLDYFRFLLRAEPVRVFAQTTWPATGRQACPDSVAVQVEFADGSSGQLDYSAAGDPAFPKESFTVFASGLVAEVVNFLELRVYRGRKRRTRSYSSKGHAEQMAAWRRFLLGETGHPFPYGASRGSMELTFAVLDSIQQARAVQLA